ncbi:MAG TPA: nickel-responsive transcriptional regulator NikR [Burkholderiales bacterium]
MERFTISLDTELAAEFDGLIKARGYSNRSEAVRDMLRSQLESFRVERHPARYCVASLSYVYNHHERDLAERLTRLQHDHHNLAISTMHAHLDHENCIETVILRGPTPEVRDFANALIAERGVRHGQLNLISADMDKTRHAHPHDDRQPAHSHRHEHLRPKN